MLTIEQRLKRILSYLNKVYGGDFGLFNEGLQSASNGSRHDVLDTLEVVSNSDGGRSAQELLEVLNRDPSGQGLQHGDLDRLEAVIHIEGRPAIKIELDSYDLSSEVRAWQFLGDVEIREKIEKVIKSVGRIEAPHDLRRPYAGTGFVVGDNLIMTNRHVAKLFTDGVGTSPLNFFAGASAGIDFKREQFAPPQVLDLDEIVMVHPYWDMALFRTKNDLSRDREPLLLSTRSLDELSTGNNVVVIGYPGKDYRCNIAVSEVVFRGRYGIKRLMPGKYNGAVQFNGQTVISHDASTLGGASGSVVVDIDSGEVIGLHFAGIYLESNFAVPTSSLAEDARLAEFSPKLRFSGQRSRSTVVAGIWNELDNGLFHELRPEPSVSDELFSGNPAPNVEQFIPRFEFDSLRATKFDWSAALATSLASYIAYSDELKGMEVCNSWRMPYFQFIENAGTECFVSGDSDVALVAFRGTEKKIGDWLIDLNTVGLNRPYGRIHRGFWFAFESVAEQIRDAIDSLGKPKLVLTGHSLGGALACIAAAEWLHDGSREVLSIYTFGQPAFGKGDLPDRIYQRVNGAYYRFVNDGDIVSMVPPTYRHAGELKHFGAGNDLKFGVDSTNESLVESAETCSEAQFDHLRMLLLQERLAKPSAEIQSTEEGLLPSFRDHRMVHYISKIATKAAGTSG